MEGGRNLAKIAGLVALLGVIAMLFTKRSGRSKQPDPAPVTVVTTAPEEEAEQNPSKAKRRQGATKALATDPPSRSTSGAVNTPSVTARAPSNTAQYIRDYEEKATPDSDSPSLAYQAAQIYQMTGDKKYLSDVNNVMTNFVKTSSAGNSDQRAALYAANISSIAAVFHVVASRNEADQAWCRSVINYLKTNDASFKNRLRAQQRDVK